MGLMSTTEEGGEDHYRNNLTGEPRKCTTPDLAALHWGMFCHMSNVHHEIEIEQSLEQVSPVQEGIAKGTRILPRA
jgi:hypothetical protein